MPKTGEEEADEARLLYVAMTRTIERLVMVHREHSIFTTRIREAIDAVRAHLAGDDAIEVAG